MRARVAGGPTLARTRLLMTTARLSKHGSPPRVVTISTCRMGGAGERGAAGWGLPYLGRDDIHLPYEGCRGRGRDWGHRAGRHKRRERERRERKRPEFSARTSHPKHSARTAHPQNTRARKGRRHVSDVVLDPFGQQRRVGLIEPCRFGTQRIGNREALRIRWRRRRLHTRARARKRVMRREGGREGAARDGGREGAARDGVCARALP